MDIASASNKVLKAFKYKNNNLSSK